MDFAHRIRRLWNRIRTQSGARRLSRRLEAWTSYRPSERARRAISGLFFLLSSLILGAWAYDEASSDARKAWEREHPPGLRVWDHALGVRSLILAPKRSKGTQAQRSLPAHIEPEGTVWMSGDGGWVAIFNSPEADPPFRLYCRKCDEAPSSWDPAGRGWGAFERVLARLELTAKEAKPHQPRRERTDPREIRY